MDIQQHHRLAIVGDGLSKVDLTSVYNLNEALLISLLATGSALGEQRYVGASVVSYVMRQVELSEVTFYRFEGLSYSLAALNKAFCVMWPMRPKSALSRLGMQVMNKDLALDISRARHFFVVQDQPVECVQRVLRLVESP